MSYLRLTVQIRVALSCGGSLTSPCLKQASFVSIRTFYTAPRGGYTPGMLVPLTPKVTIKDKFPDAPKTYAFLIGYNGLSYSGVKRHYYSQESATVDGHLTSALCEVGILSDIENATLRSLLYTPAVKTCKSASGVHQVVSLTCKDPPHECSDLVSKLNATLPDDIRVFDIRRVDDNFNAQRHCTSCTYSYTMPVSAFFRRLHEAQHANTLFTDKRMSEINDILSVFVGSNNFFNFHRDCKSAVDGLVTNFALMPQLRTHSGVQFATLECTSSSFLYEQLRKMLGMAIAVIRGHYNKSDLERTLTEKKRSCIIPVAPAEGLCLEMVLFDEYNRHTPNGQLPLLWENEENEEIAKFREKLQTSIMEAQLKQNLKEC